jgi:abortive infection bacteriophage resistance protein
MNYIKQALDYPQILQQLKDRGLLFHDDLTAVKELSIISVSLRQSTSKIDDIYS